MTVVFDDLFCGGPGVYRDTEEFCYGSDSILLANAVAKRARPGESILELCAGTGAVSILAAAKSAAHFTAVELSPHLAALCEKAIEQNAQQERISVLCHDLNTLADILPPARFDAVCCNPPYHRGGTAGKHAESTHQLSCTLEQVALSACRMLKNGGRLHLVYPAQYFAAACAALSLQTLAVKRITPVCGKKDTPPYLTLIECKKGGAPGLIWENSWILGEETERHG